MSLKSDACPALPKAPQNAISSHTWTQLTPVMPSLLLEILKYNCVFYHFSILRWRRLLKSVIVEDKDLFDLYSQYHGCWWPGDARSQVISIHGIDLVFFLEFSSFCTRRVKLDLSVSMSFRFSILVTPNQSYFNFCCDYRYFLSCPLQVL